MTTRDAIEGAALGTLMVVWFVVGVRLSAKAAQEMEKEDGRPWLAHLFFNDFWRVQSARGQALAGRSLAWGLGGMVGVVALALLFHALLDLLFAAG